MYDQTQTRVRVSGMLSAGDRFVLAKSERSALGSRIRAHDPACRFAEGRRVQSLPIHPNR